MAGGYLFVTSISEGSMLAVLAERSCDMGMIGYEMTLLVPGRAHADPGGTGVRRDVTEYSGGRIVPPTC